MANRLPPGILGYVTGQETAQRGTANQIAQLQGVLGLQRMMEEQAMAREMAPVMAADRAAATRLRDAQIADLERKGVLSMQQQQAHGALANLLAGGGYQGAVEGPTAVAMNEQDALRQVQEAEAQGRPLGVNVPNPGSVQGLAVLANPQQAIPEILRQQRPPTPGRDTSIIPVAGGYFNKATNEYVRTAPEAAPRPAPPEPLVPVKDPKTGRPVMLPRSQASGLEPASLSGREDDIGVRRLGQFSTALEKGGIPSAYAILEDARAKITPDVLPYLTGPAGFIPDAALSKKVTDARQALQRAQNIELKERSGAAVTESEYQRYKKEAGVGLFKKPEQITAWLDMGQRALDRHYQSIAAGFPEDVRNRYFEEAGRVAPFGTTRPPAAPAAPTGIDALLEKYK